MSHPTTTLALLFLLGTPALASSLSEQDQLVRDATAQAHASWGLLDELLSLPNDAHYPEHIAPNVAWMERAFLERGFAVRHLETPGAPLLVAEKRSSGATKTVLAYLQVDGQPVDQTLWSQADAWKPVLKQRTADGWSELPWERLTSGQVDPEWRIFARSAADAKGPIVMFLAALDALAASGRTPTVNLRVVMDFEEELGSPNLAAAVVTHRDLLAADALVILDGPRHASNQPTLYFGARGIATVSLTVFGPRLAQHSGHYGNWAPNPALGLAQLLASMKDPDGRVTIPGFYDGIELDATTRGELAAIPDDNVEILTRLGIARPDQIAPTYQEAIQYPSLNIRGMAAGWIGEQTRTIVPATATAEIDIRLVPEVDADRLLALVRQHIEAAGYHLIAGAEPTDEERARYPRLASLRTEVSYQAFRTPWDGAAGRWLTTALTRAFGQPPVRIRMTGGSIPIAPFVTTLGLPAVGVPGVQLDNNQHSPNENLRVGNFVDGVRTYLAFLTEPFPGEGTRE